jgi:hypothetical protein
MLHRVLVLCASALGLAGCAIHPLPEDVAGVDTYDIVRQIRCETREALKSAIIKWLDLLARDEDGEVGDPIAKRLLIKYASEPELISTFNPNLFPGPEYIQVRNVINTFADAGIAYTFELTMTEDNNLSTDISLLKPVTQPKFTLGLSAGAKRKRSNDRVFTVTDNFRFLLTQLNATRGGRPYCDGRTVQANYVYPIAGRIGVDRLVSDFVNLTVFGNLSGKDAKPGASGAPTMADKLTFTTTVNISATPKVEFAPVGNAFQLATASVTGEAIRTDVHQVTVSLAIATSGTAGLGSLRSYLFSNQRGAPTALRGTGIRREVAPSVYVGQRVTGGGTPSEILAVIAIDQLKSRELEIVPSP